MDESTLDQRGITPLMHVVSNIQSLYKGERRTFAADGTPSYDTKDRQGLTAAIAYLHSHSIEALFSFSIDGDVGKDPNLMSLWFG
jgi:endothelin-converting enzyme